MENSLFFVQAERMLWSWAPWLLIAPLTFWWSHRVLPGTGRWGVTGKDGGSAAAAQLRHLHRWSHWSRWLLIHALAGLLVIAACLAWRSSSWQAGAPLAGRGPPAWAGTPAPADGQGRSGPTMTSSLPGPPPQVRVLVDGILYVLFASLGLASGSLARARQRDRHALLTEAELARAKLAALQLQLNPHFLFNALNSISTLIHADPSAADDMVAELGQLLRAALDTAAEPEIALERELANLDCYLSIEQRRFGERLRVERHLDEGVLQALVPTFTLQPLVENAIKHGIEKQVAPGYVLLRVRRAQQRLCIEIEDNGPGLNADTPGSDRGIGLSNIRARLEQLYPGHSLLQLRSGAAAGCTVRLEFPFRQAGPLQSQPQPQPQPQPTSSTRSLVCVSPAVAPIQPGPRR